MESRQKLICAVAVCMFVLIGAIHGVPSKGRCDFPPGLREAVSKDYPGMRLVELDDLSASSRRLYKKDHGSRCPGLVRLNFYGDKKPTWALVLVGEGPQGRKTELVLARQIGKQWEIKSLETADAAPVPVVWRDKPGQYEDVHGEKMIRAKNPVIVFCGYESWAIVYAWTGQGIEKVWISD